MTVATEMEQLTSCLLVLEKTLTDALRHSEVSGMPEFDSEQMSALKNIMDRLRPLLWICLNRETSRPQGPRRPPVSAVEGLQTEKSAG